MLTNKKGFTFIELMVAIAIVSIVFAAATATSVLVVKNNSRANEITTANKTLTAALETLRGRNAFHLEEGTFEMDIDGTAVSYTVEKIHNRLARVEASTLVKGIYGRGRRVSASTMINNMWGPDIGSHIVVVN
jgi:prepilin-type N-terminal cleavage/methylation domain-containing protein